MKAAILYGSKVKLSRAHMPVRLRAGFTKREHHCDYFVRMEVWRDLPRETDLSELLNKAKPEDGETVLNTVWL